MCSGADRVECVLGQARIAQGLLFADVRLHVDDEAVAPPRDQHIGRFDLHSAVLSAPTQDAQGERVLAELEEGLRLRADLASPGLLEVSMPLPQPLVPTVYGADSRKTGVELDIGIEEGNERVYVTCVVCLDCS